MRNDTDDLISILSELRSQYNCFDEAEEPYYRALSEAIKKLSGQADGDTISRQAAIDEIRKCRFVVDAIEKIRALPSVQQDCTECADYDHETHSCPKYCEVIRQTLAEAKQERTGRWIYDENDFMTKCSECGCHPWFGVVPTAKEATKKLPHCPMCLAKMEGEE